MVVPRMHDDEVDVDDDLARRLVASQCPQFAGLALTRVDAWGTDHVIFRLGDRLSLRLPKIGWAAEQGVKEQRCLPVLAPHLPVEVPVPVGVGEPACGYPFHWYVSPWLVGENPVPGEGRADPFTLAADLARFVLALRRVDTAIAPPLWPGQRGGPLAPADRSTRGRAEELRADVAAGNAPADLDVDALLAVWDAGLRAPVWTGTNVWVHGDLSDGNLLVRGGRLTGVIDWGSATAGDPAVELMAAWSLFDAPGRTAFRDALGFVDDAMWLRGRAWAASGALQALPYYRTTNRVIVARSWRVVGEILSSH